LALTGERWRTQGRNTWHVLTVAEGRDRAWNFELVPVRAANLEIMFY